MRNLFTRRGLPGKTALLGALLTGAAAAPAAAQTAYAITLNAANTYSLATFQLAAPGTFTSTVPITGLASGQDIAGIDVRPATGQIFALGYNDGATTSNAQLYTLSTAGALTPVGGVLTLPLGSDATRVGFDFNPTVDRIRVTAGNRANYRLNPNNGAIAATDGLLTYATGDANASQTPSVGSSAYTNSYIGATSTTLYNVDDANSRLVTQNPPNDGTLNTVGALGVSVSSNTQVSDLDVYFNPTTSQNTAYLSVSTLDLSTFTVSNQLYTVNLTSGAATSVGALAGGGAVFGTGVGVADIAIAIDRTVPAAVTGQLAYALAGTNLLTFDTALPRTIRTSVGLTGVDAAQTLVGLDVRPANNALYALGYNAAAASGTNNSQLYTINATTGVATPLNAAFRLELGTGSVGFDFNPTVDRIRVVAANRNNYRLNPTPGAAPLAATDGPVAYTSGTSTPSIGAVAYTNSFAGSTATTLYNYDENLNQLNIQATANPPADGQLTPVGPSGITVNTSAPTAVNVDLDIYSTAANVNTAYLVANTGNTTAATSSSLYTVNLGTGTATLVGAIGNGIAVRDLAVAAATGVVTATRPAADLAADLTLYPNPVAGEASLGFTLARAARVEVVVSDLLGRTLATLDAGLLPAGAQAVRWPRGAQAAGLYFFTLRLDGQPAGTRQALLTQ